MHEWMIRGAPPIVTLAAMRVWFDRTVPRWVLAAFFVAAGCADAPGSRTAAGSPNREGADREPVAAESPESESRPRVLFLGTSLTAGFGLAEEEAFPALLAALLAERGLAVEAVNAGVSGDTSAGGLNRLDWLLRAPPEVMVLELGANDGLRGLPVEMTEANLRTAIDKAQAAGARVIVAGMMMPPNYGETYAREFAAVFPRVAEATGSMLVPFLLEGVAADPELNLADGIHPNAAGHERLALTLLPFLVESLAGLDSAS